MQPKSSNIQTFLHSLDWTCSVHMKYKTSIVNILYLIFYNDLPSWLYFEEHREQSWPVFQSPWWRVQAAITRSVFQHSERTGTTGEQLQLKQQYPWLLKRPSMIRYITSCQEVQQKQSSSAILILRKQETIYSFSCMILTPKKDQMMEEHLNQHPLRWKNHYLSPKNGALRWAAASKCSTRRGDFLRTGWNVHVF